ncbi:MAG: DUF1622 domain-containing protein [Candidatus Margulisiibacteriota bacterium]
MTFYDAINLIVRVISVLGLAVIVWGILLVLRDFLKDPLSDDAQSRRALRQKLGSFLILGLEFFIAADIIRTILRPDWNDIGMLAAIIALRTVLSYFLGLELREKA